MAEEHGPFYVKRRRGEGYSSYTEAQLRDLRAGTRRAKAGGFFTHPEAADEIIRDINAELRYRQRRRLRRE